MNQKVSFLLFSTSTFISQNTWTNFQSLSFRFAAGDESFSGLFFLSRKVRLACFCSKHNLWLRCALYCVEGNCQRRSLRPCLVFDTSLPQWLLSICFRWWAGGETFLVALCLDRVTEIKSDFNQLALAALSLMVMTHCSKSHDCSCFVLLLLEMLCCWFFGCLHPNHMLCMFQQGCN